MMAGKRQTLEVWRWFLAGVLLLSGCAGFGTTLKPPRVSLADIRLTELKVFESIFQIELRVFNLNDGPIEVKGLDCDLELNGKKFASGVSDVQTEIPSYGTTTLPVVVYSSVLDMVKGVVGLQNKDRLKYKIVGNLRVEAGFLVPSLIPYESEGEISLEGIMEPRR
jgi:LEA14-like dessication related protein